MGQQLHHQHYGARCGQLNLFTIDPLQPECAGLRPFSLGLSRAGWKNNSVPLTCACWRRSSARITLQPCISCRPATHDFLLGGQTSRDPCAGGIEGQSRNTVMFCWASQTSCDPCAREPGWDKWRRDLLLGGSDLAWPMREGSVRALAVTHL